MKKNKLLFSITNKAALLMLISACTLDSDGWIPFIIFVISGGWVALFCYVNREWFGKEVKKNVDIEGTGRRCA